MNSAIHSMQGLYLVTPNWDDTDRMLASTRAALEAGAAIVQYRHKEASPELRREQAAALLALFRRHGRPLVINDHVALCLTLDADGVHVGGTDMAVATARATLGPGKIVGASCYGDLALATESMVPLTSVRQPKDVLGRSAVDLLLAEIESAGSLAHEARLLEPSLIVRGSAP